MYTADEIVAKVRSFGNDARDLRDAAHEACHAIEVDITPGCWDRETIHRAIMDHLDRSGVSGRWETTFQIATIVGFEVTARAVEQIVCAQYKIEIGDWADIAYMEALQGSGIRLPSVAWMREKITAAQKTAKAKRLAATICELPGQPAPKPKRKPRTKRTS